MQSIFFSLADHDVANNGGDSDSDSRSSSSNFDVVSLEIVILRALMMS